MGTSRDGVEPTVLLVGAGERFAPAFQAAFSRHQVQVETAELDSVVNAVIVTAPDWVLLVGTAAEDGGAAVLQKLAGLSRNFTVPVVVLSDDAELEAKLSAFRHGATAVLPRSASIDATAERVAKLARETPEAGGAAAGAVGDATLDEFIGVLSKQLQSGLVSSLPSGTDPHELKLTFGRGRPLTEFLDTFVRSVRRHVVRAEPLSYELGGVRAVDAFGVAPTSLPASAPAIDGLRVALADDDTPRADAVAQELRKRGVTVVVTDLAPSPTRFQTLRQADPTVFVIGEEHAHTAGDELLRRLRRDSRLRWASLLIVRWSDIWVEERGAPSLARLESTLAGLVEPERALFARAEARVAFDTRLETTGPARCLRVLADSARPLRVRIENRRVELTLDLSDGLVVGAEGRTLGLEPKQLSGVSALSALLVLGSGRVRVEPVLEPASANVMTPVEAALTMADAETPPIAPSIPATGTVSLNPPGPSAPSSAPVGSIRPVPVVSVAAPPSVPRPVPRSVPRSARSATLRFAPPAPSTPVGSLLTSPPALAEVPAVVAPSSAPPNEPNPLAMTLSAPVVEPSSVIGAHTTRERPFQRLHAVAAWFAQHEATLHGKRIPFSTTAVLVGLGALQGVLIVSLYAGARWLSRPHAALERSASTHEVVSEHSAPTPASARTLAQKARAHSTHALAPGSLAPTVAPVASALVVASNGDGSGRSMPTCEVLLAVDAPPRGFYPGAALEQMRLGRTAIVRGDLNAAQVALCRAASWNASSAEIALELALVLLLDRDGEQAATWARRASELAPNSAEAQDALGDALARLGSDAEARTAFLAAAHIDTADQPGLRALITRAMKQADHALRHADFAGAEREFRRALSLEPTSSAAASGLAYALLELGDVAAAVTWAKHAVELAPRSSGARLAFGDALAKSGDKSAAADEWREATLLEPSNREAQKRLRAVRRPPT